MIKLLHLSTKCKSPAPTSAFLHSSHVDEGDDEDEDDDSNDDVDDSAEDDDDNRDDHHKILTIESDKP